MSAADTERLASILKGTAEKAPTGDVKAHRAEVVFPNSGGMIADPDYVWGETPIKADVEIFLTAKDAYAVATMPGGGKNVLGRVTVGKGDAEQVRSMVNPLMSGRVLFSDLFEKVVYAHPGSH